MNQKQACEGCVELFAALEKAVLCASAGPDAEGWEGPETRTNLLLEAIDALGRHRVAITDTPAEPKPCERCGGLATALQNLSDGVTKFCEHEHDFYEWICDPNDEAIEVLADTPAPKPTRAQLIGMLAVLRGLLYGPVEDRDEEEIASVLRDTAGRDDWTDHVIEFDTSWRSFDDVTPTDTPAEPEGCELPEGWVWDELEHLTAYARRDGGGQVWVTKSGAVEARGADAEAVAAVLHRAALADTPADPEDG